MLTEITLSLRSKNLLDKLVPLLSGDDVQLLQVKNNAPVASNALIAWLKKDINHNKAAQFLLETLRASVLDDLHHSFLTESEKATHQEEKKVDWYGKLQFLFLALAGTLLAICEGFDRIVSILSMFNAVPAAVLIMTGLLFSALSVVVFYGFGLVAISNNLGVKLSSSPKLIDVLIEQVEHIKLIRKKIDDCYARAENKADLTALNDMLAMLILRNNALDQARALYLDDLNNPVLNTAKSIMAAIAGLLFFGGGFVSGQTVSMAISGFFTTTATTAFAPILLTSMAVGFAALSIYWYVERPGLEHFILCWCGLDEEKIAKLADKNTVSKQKLALDKLQTKINTHLNALEKIENLSRISAGPSQSSSAPRPDPQNQSNRHDPSFFGRTDSKGNSSSLGLSAVSLQRGPG